MIHALRILNDLYKKHKEIFSVAFSIVTVENGGKTLRNCLVNETDLEGKNFIRLSP